MDYLTVAWSYEDELSNIKAFKVNFKEAREVILNSSSLKLRNIHKDYTFIGPVDGLSKILAVYCMKDDGFRRILTARKAILKEENAYFSFLAMGGLE